MPEIRFIPRPICGCCLAFLLLLTILPALAVEDSAAPATEQMWTLNFKDAEIGELIRFVANATGITMIIEPQVKGRIQVVSSHQVGTKELYDLFLSILEVHGFAAIRSGDVVRIVSQKNARSLAVPVEAADDRGASNSREVVTQVVQLDNIDAAKLIPILRPLVPQQAHMAAYSPSNAIIISDSAANISRIRQIIDRIDRSAVEETEVIQLRYASAEDIVKILGQLEKRSAGEAEEPNSVRLVPDKRSNSLLINGDGKDRRRIRSLVAHLDKPLEQTGNARVRYLEYAQAKDLAEVLTKVIKNMSATEGGGDAAKGATVPTSIEADEATNSLIITADPGLMQTLDAIIARLDIRRAQVLVEAIIVEMVADHIKDLGIQWLFKSDHGFGSSNNEQGVLEGIGNAVGDGTDVSAGDIAPVLAATPGTILGLANFDANGTSFIAVINALQNNLQANILSTPSLLTLDNSPASITVGQEVPFITGSFSGTGTGGSNPQNPFQTIERQSVGTTLNVTPHINSGDSIVLEISQEVSSLTGLKASDIITNERKIESKVLVRDGDIIVLGGLIEDNVQENVRKVPLLGDIPGLGKLFRSTNSTINKKNLLVFIRPTIIRDSTALEGATAEKYQLIRDEQEARRVRGTELLPIDQIPLLPEWQEQLKKAEEIRSHKKVPAPDAAQLPAP